MNFDLCKEHRLLRNAVRKFAEQRVLAKVLEHDQKEIFPRKIIAEMGKLGLIGLVNSDRYGGARMGHLARMITIEELSRVYPSLGFFLQAGNLFMYAVESFGTEEQKERYLPDLCKGIKVSAFGVTEATGGSDPTVMMTSAQEDGDFYIINGRKTFITNPEAADVLGFLCKHGEGFSVFYVDSGTPGYEITHREPRPGFRCIPVNELAFSNCKLPKHHLLGKAGRGLASALTTISTIGRTGAAGVALGALVGAFEGALKYCKERVLYGKPIANLQAIQFTLADMSTDIEAARWLSYYPAWQLDKGKSPREIGAEIARAKLFTVDALLKHSLKAQQIMGAYGQAPEYRVEMYLRDGLELLTAGGTQEIMRVTVGREITR